MECSYARVPRAPLQITYVAALHPSSECELLLRKPGFASEGPNPLSETNDDVHPGRWRKSPPFRCPPNVSFSVLDSVSEALAAVSDRIDHFTRSETGLQALYERYADWFHARLVSRYGRQDAEDIVQETWLRVSQYQVGREISHPRALLMRIASNLALDRAVRRGRRSRHLEQFRANAPHRVLPVQTEDLLIKELILGLPEPLRDVFLLSRVDGLTNAQIGEKLGISPKTVEWRMTRALAHCAAQLRR